MTHNVLITGASSGIGAALALSYARKGARLALFARRAQQLSDVAEAALAAGAREALVLVGDTTSAADVQSAMERLEGWETVDRAFLNAGGGGGDSSQWEVSECCNSAAQNASEFSAEHVLGLMDLNYAGQVRWLEHLLRAAPAKGRRIAITGSMAADGLLRSSGGYMASKMAVRGLVRGLERSAAARGITLVLIEPGFVATEQLGGRAALPFLLGAEEAATAIAEQVERGRRTIRIPWQMSAMNRICTLLPRNAYLALLSSLGRWSPR